MTADQIDQYDAVVVGGGSAGLTAVGNLLDRKISRILWVDDCGFTAGRVNRLYREVPSNTQTWLIISYAEAISPFRKIISGAPCRSRWEEASDSDSVASNGKDDKLSEMRALPQDKYCELSYAADMIMMLTDGVKNYPGVVMQQGRVTDATLDERAAPPRRWTVHLNRDTYPQTVQTQRLVLCQGASPIDTPLSVPIPNIQPLDLDTALSPSRLTQFFDNVGPVTVAVIGASHSAILVLMNLYSLASQLKPDLRVRWFSRHPLRYAVQMDGWILRDTTGLKGEAAKWAAENLEPNSFPNSDVSNYFERIQYDREDEEGTFEERIPGCNYYVQAIGYKTDPTPMLKTRAGKEIEPYFHHERGSFHYVKESEDGAIGDLAQVPGLYGCGVAYPERIKDPHGNVELAVGFLKFMKFVKKVRDDWN